MFPDAGFTLAWQHLDATRNIEASAAIMRGDAKPMRKLLDAIVAGRTWPVPQCRELTGETCEHQQEPWCKR